MWLCFVGYAICRLVIVVWWIGKLEFMGVYIIDKESWKR